MRVPTLSRMKTLWLCLALSGCSLDAVIGVVPQKTVSQGVPGSIDLRLCWPDPVTAWMFELPICP